MKHTWKTFLAAFLAVTFCMIPAAQALTADQLKDLLEAHYINPLSDKVREAETVDDVLNALGDPYTTYMSPEEYGQFQSAMSDGMTVGIGITALGDELGLLILGIYDDSPAEALGLVPGDRIIQVEGRSAAGVDPVEITSWFQGEAGTTVRFVVLHQDGQEEAYETQRSELVIPATSVTVLDESDTGYIACDSFGPETQGHFLAGVQANESPDLWILDLRRNGGGDVAAAAQTMGVFLGEGPMFYLRNSEDHFFRYLSEQPLATDRPLIVLTSNMTASAAEIFAMGIRDYERGLLIGSTTFGKGIAQVILTRELYPSLLEEGEAVSITSFQSYGINENTPHRIGVIPDLLVPAVDAGNIALLLSPFAPEEDNSGWLLLYLGGQSWYIDPSHAEGEGAPYLSELLSALPPSPALFLGEGGEWSMITAEQAVQALALPEYTPRTFTDVEGQPCQKAADTLHTYDILIGYGDGTFRPDNTLTRAELCAILVQAMGLPIPQGLSGFSDVAPDSWYEPVIRAAQAAGYMYGVGQGRFNPEHLVTHEQMITVLGRMAAELNLGFRQASQEVPDEIDVPDSYSSWSAPWAWLLAESRQNVLGWSLSMLYAPLSEIDPTAPATRGETAQVLYEILSSVSILP